MEEINFEEAMKKLEQITVELEKGDLSLDESVKKFEEGIKLSKECNKILEDSEKRINILINTFFHIQTIHISPKMNLAIFIHCENSFFLSCCPIT